MLVAVACLVVVLVEQVEVFELAVDSLEHIEVFELAVDSLEHIVSFVVVVGKSVAYHRTLNWQQHHVLEVLYQPI